MKLDLFIFFVYNLFTYYFEMLDMAMRSCLLPNQTLYKIIYKENRRSDTNDSRSSEVVRPTYNAYRSDHQSALFLAFRGVVIDWTKRFYRYIYLHIIDKKSLTFNYI